MGGVKGVSKLRFLKPQRELWAGQHFYKCFFYFLLKKINLNDNTSIDYRYVKVVLSDEFHIYGYFIFDVKRI